MIKNLVYEGGGVKGTAYAGAIANIDLSQIEKVAGTSAGSIVAAMIAVGYSAIEIKNIVFNMDFKKFKDKWWPFRILNKYGLYKGDYFLNWFEKLIVAKMGKPNATFRDLAFAGKKELHVVASNLTTGKEQIFSLQHTSDVIISEAVRCSMSIPIFFDAFKLSQGFDTTNIFVDGGLLWNYPIQIFDNGSINPETLGFCFWDYSSSRTNNLTFGDFDQYVLTLVDTLLTSQDVGIKEDTANDFRTIKIDDFGIKSTNFNISATDKQRLYDSGLQYYTNYLKANN